MLGAFIVAGGLFYCLGAANLEQARSRTGA
jgi:hypothetical protein